MAPLARPIPPAGPSAPFRVAPATYFRCAVLRPGMGRTAIILTVAVAALLTVLSVVLADLRMALIALMVIFVAAPMIMALVFFSLALSPEATATTLPHTIEILPGGDIVISYTSEYEDAKPRDREVITTCDISDTRLTGDKIVFRLTSGRLIILPLDAIGIDRADLIDFSE